MNPSNINTWVYITGASCVHIKLRLISVWSLGCNSLTLYQKHQELCTNSGTLSMTLKSSKFDFATALKCPIIELMKLSGFYDWKIHLYIPWPTWYVHSWKQLTFIIEVNKLIRLFLLDTFVKSGSLFTGITFHYIL